MRIAFLGTPEFAIPSLNVCNDFGKVVSVITQPDKESGRGKKVKYTFIKEEALMFKESNFSVKDVNKYISAIVVSYVKQEIENEAIG